MINNMSNISSATLVAPKVPMQPTDQVQFYSRIALVIIAVILFILLMRLFWLWYWKVNKIVGLLEKIEQNTRK